MDIDTPPTTSPARSDALARATALANRAKQLRRAQVEVQDLTAREVKVMARAAASFFDAIPLPEFSANLLPSSARVLRRMRHRILHRTVHNTETGTMIHAMLLGRDGVLRLFSARTADTRDLLMSLEAGRTLPQTVVRDIVEWTPMLRVQGFRPFEILEKLSGSLDAVEAQLAEAEEKVQIQKQALESGDLSALLPGRGESRAAATESPDGEVVEANASDEPLPPLEVTLTAMPVAAPVTVTPAPPIARSPFDLFDVVEKVAATVPTRPAPAVPMTEPSPLPDLEEPEEWDDPEPVARSRYALDDEPEEWDDPEPVHDTTSFAPVRSSLFPILPPPR